MIECQILNLLLIGSSHCQLKYQNTRVGKRTNDSTARLLQVNIVVSSCIMDCMGLQGWYCGLNGYRCGLHFALATQAYITFGHSVHKLSAFCQFGCIFLGRGDWSCA